MPFTTFPQLHLGGTGIFNPCNIFTYHIIHKWALGSTAERAVQPNITCLFYFLKEKEKLWNDWHHRFFSCTSSTSDWGENHAAGWWDGWSIERKEATAVGVSWRTQPSLVSGDPVLIHSLLHFIDLLLQMVTLLILIDTDVQSCYV